jgi:hypothetical protein
MFLEEILHSFMQLEAVRCRHTQRHNFKERKKKFNRNQINNECVEDLLHQDAGL